MVVNKSDISKERERARERVREGERERKGAGKIERIEAEN